MKRLAPVWQFQAGDYTQGLQSTPSVIDGVPYLSTTHSQVFALAAASGKMVWQYKYPMPRGAGAEISRIERSACQCLRPKTLPPVERSFAKDEVSFKEGTMRRHDAMLAGYTDQDREAILAFLHAVVK